VWCCSDVVVLSVIAECFLVRYTFTWAVLAALAFAFSPSPEILQFGMVRVTMDSDANRLLAL
jgi:hypothetical protein